MKKLSATIICFLMILTCCLTGCAGFSVNKVKYYNETVAKVGNTSISRHELLSAYNSYGKSYFEDQQGKSKKEALEETLNLLMEQEHIYQYALSKGDYYAPTSYQVNEMINDLFESLDEQMDEYVTSAKKMLDIDAKDDAEEEEDEDKETAYKFEDYNYTLSERRAELRTKKIYFTDASKTTETNNETQYFNEVEYIAYTYVEPTTYQAIISKDLLTDFNSENTLTEIVNEYFRLLKVSIKEDEQTNNKIVAKCKSLFAEDLRDYEFYLRNDKNKPYNTVTDDLIYRYFERTFKAKVKSQYLTNVRTMYLKNESLSINALVEKYKYLANASYNAYHHFQESYKSAMKDIGTKGDTVLYHNQNLDDGTKFGYFSHTLLNFSDEQKNELKALEKNKELGMDQEQYKLEYNAIIGKTQVKPRNPETGLVDEEAVAVSLANILEEYEEITKINNPRTKLDKFTEFMFKYTGDTATLNAGMPYVVGTNGNSAMEEAFTKEAVRLINENVVGAMTPATTNNMCVTSYGIHLLYYIGDISCQDIAFSNTDSVYISLTNKAGNPNNLYYLEVNPLTRETYFDMLFDAVYPATSEEETYTSNTGYDAEEDRIIELSKSVNKQTVYTTKVKGTLALL